MAQRSKPSMSIILVTPNSYDTVARVIACYSKQSVVNEIELVLGVPNPTKISAPEKDFAAFHSWQIMQTTSIKNVGLMKAEAIIKASADVIVFGEDHSFPTKNWAEALIERHREGWVAVGPRVVNLNGKNNQTWAQAYMEYGPWMPSIIGGEREFLPGHNSSFKKSILMGYGENLATLLLSEYFLFEDLVRSGHRLFFEARAVTRHLNFELLGPLLTINFLAGWQFAAWRSKRSILAKRIFYVLGAPAIPFLRFGRVLKMMLENSQPQKVLPIHLFYLAVNVLADGVGQFLGYLIGPHDVTQRIFPYEFDRTRFVDDLEVLENVCVQ